MAKTKKKNTKAPKKKIKTKSKIVKNTKAIVKKKAVKSIFLKKVLKKFKELLLKKRDDLVGEVQHITSDSKQSQRDASGDLSGYALHMADMATDHYDREFNLGLASAEQRIIYEIDEALKRIEDGSYGICFTCDKTITKKRLIAVPYAKHCVDCQEKEELLQKRIS